VGPVVVGGEPGLKAAINRVVAGEKGRIWS
jgi:hypothetical protein